LAAIATFALETTTASAEEKSTPQAAQCAPHDCPAATVAPLIAPPASAAAHEKQIATVYAVGDLLAKLHQDGFDEDAARGIVEIWAATAISQADATGARTPFGFRPILWHNGSLVVQTSEAGHRRIREGFETLHKYGHAEIVVDVHFTLLDNEELTAMLADGATTSMPAPAEENKACIEGCDGERALEHHEGTQVAPMHCVAEQTSPICYRVMDDKEARRWLGRCDGEKSSEILQAPRVTVLNGQTAQVADASQTPFVVGMKDVKGALAPQIRVVSEGTSLQLRPLADRAGTIHLDFAASFSKIRKVETVKVGGGGPGNVTLQVPEVATVRLEGGAALKSGQWFVLVGSQPDNAAGQAEPATTWERLFGGGKQFKAHSARQLVIMLRAEKILQPPPAKVASVQGP
jgi:hypothetical protein